MPPLPPRYARAVTRPELAEVVIADPPAAWSDLGFSVDGGVATVGEVSLRLAGSEPSRGGIVAWSLRGIDAGELDGLDTWSTHQPPPVPNSHPNGALEVDHVVVTTPDVDRTFEALERAGFQLRRTRDATAPDGRAIRQGFYRVGQPLLEVVGPLEPVGDAPARFWGLTITVADIDACARLLGSRLGDVRDAVQPGRRIATVRAEAGVSPALAFMSPAPG